MTANIHLCLIDQGDRVRDGSDSKEQEYIFPFGYELISTRFYTYLSIDLTDNR